MQQPDEEDHELDALFRGRESFQMPGEEDIVGGLDAFTAAGAVDLPPLDLGTPTTPADPDATLAPEEAFALSAGSEVPDLPEGLAQHPRYRILRLLGKGGMGAVYQAEHRLMHRLVALKVIHPQFTSSPAAVERFRREVRTAARLHHPNIVAAYDADQAGLSHFLVMEYVEGTNLGDYLRAKGPLPIREACDYARQAALGLQYAHTRGMVHRDLKPDNLMRTEDGHVKILDFGLARLREVWATDEPIVGQGAVEGGQLTLAGVMMGTPDYMAPEQADDSSKVDIRDIYSLGCTLYQLLTGEVPYPGVTALDKVMRHAEDAVPCVTTKRPDAPKALADVVAKMMAKDPAARYQTPAEVAEALRPFTEAPPPAALPAVSKEEPSSSPRQDWSWQAWLIFLGALMVLSLLAMLLAFVAL